MCRMSSAQYDLYKRTNSELGRSLLGWLRGLWQRRAPHVEEVQVVEFPADTTSPDQRVDRRRSKAA